MSDKYKEFHGELTKVEEKTWRTYVRFLEKITECPYDVLDTGNANMLVFQQIAATLTHAALTKQSMDDLIVEMPSAGRGI